MNTPKYQIPNTGKPDTRHTYDLVIAESAMRGAVREILEDSRAGKTVSFALYRSQGDTTIELFARQAPSDHAAPDGRLLVWTASQIETLYPPIADRFFMDSSHRIAVGLAIGTGALEDQIQGLVRVGMGEVRRLRSVRLIGPRMPRLNLTESEPAQTPLQWHLEKGIYSRLIGALGGLETFSRIQKARIAVVGAGGNGGLAAVSLARFMGPEARLGLIDPDPLEPSNSAAWEMPEAAEREEGRFKADALAHRIRRMPDPPRVEVVPASVLDWSALRALKEYDILVNCVDNPAARYAAAFLATLTMRPLIDIATGVFLGGGPEEHSRIIEEETAAQDANSLLFRYGCLPSSLLATGARSMGADVRLTVPDTSESQGSCLLCRGGVGDIEQVRAALENYAPTQRTQERRAPFWKQRAGSLYLVNSDAVNQGIRLLLSFLDGQTAGSEHLQMNVTLAAPPVWRSIVSPRNRDCPLCRLTGLGDAGLSLMKQVISP